MWQSGNLHLPPLFLLSTSQPAKPPYLHLRNGSQQTFRHYEAHKEMSRTSSNTNERTRLLNTSQQPYSTPEPGSDAHPKPHHNLAGLSPLKFRIVCISLWSCTFLASFDSTVVATLLSPIGSYFHASNQASWLGTAYLLSLCCFTPMYGRFSDLSRRVAFMTALFCFTLGTALCGVAPSMYTLIGARCVAGIGGGGIPSVSTIIMTDLVDLRHRGLYQVSLTRFAMGSGGADWLEGVCEHLFWARRSVGRPGRRIRCG